MIFQYSSSEQRLNMLFSKICRTAKAVVPCRNVTVTSSTRISACCLSYRKFRLVNCPTPRRVQTCIQMKPYSGSKTFSQQVSSISSSTSLMSSASGTLFPEESRYQIRPDTNSSNWYQYCNATSQSSVIHWCLGWGMILKNQYGNTGTQHWVIYVSMYQQC